MLSSSITNAGRNMTARATRLFGLLVALVIASLALTSGNASAHHPGHPDHSQREDRAKGLVYQGLHRGDPHGPCKGEFELRSKQGAHLGCTHGPDPAPDGVDVQAPRSIEDLQAETDNTVGLTPCVGDGISGNRVEAIYAVASDMPDRYADVAPLIHTWAAEMDDALNRSAQKTGGTRHIRFRTGSNACELIVSKVTLSSTGDDSFANTKQELRDQGFTESNRKFVTWVDANPDDGVDDYCGIGERVSDDSPGQGNSSNGDSSQQGLISRIDPGCWTGQDKSVALHELVHNLGGVQTSAPNTSGAGHCTDENDIMCYSDKPNFPTMRFLCNADQEELLDCNNDDYFHTNPPSGSYLATKWNTANSSFLSTTIADTAAPTVTLPPQQDLYGSVSSGEVKALIQWTATDYSGIRSYQVQQSVNGSSWSGITLPSPTTVYSIRSLVPGNSYRFRMRATDNLGRTSAWSAGPSFTVSVRDQSDPTIAYTGTWRTLGTSNYYGGTIRNTNTANDSASMSFTGRNIGWVATKGPAGGIAKVYIDGVLETTVNLYSATAQYRSVVFKKRYASSGTHTIRVVKSYMKLETPGSTYVDVDAFAILR